MERDEDDLQDDIEEIFGNALLLQLLNVVNFEEPHEGNAENWVNVPVDTRAFQLMGDPAFQLHFRMSRVTFEALYEVIRDHMVENQLIERERYPLDLMILHCLWILATPDSFRSVAMQFGTTKGTIHRHYLRIIGVLCDLAPRFITWPSQDERRHIENAFHAYSGFPGIVGCVDGSLMVVTAPTIQPRRYIDRHHQYSINCQVVCDHNLVVRDLYVGEAGALNDARVFRRSPLSRQLLTNPNILEPHQHIIGDSIYMLTDKLLTPFRNNGHLDRWKRLYNYLLCKCRARVEHCFGKLFSQWRRLKFLHSFDYEYAVETNVASFVLQNFMILGGHDAPEEVRDEPEGQLLANEPEHEMVEQLLEGDFDLLPEEFLRRHPLVQLLRQARIDGAHKREQLVTHLQQNL